MEEGDLSTEINNESNTLDVTVDQEKGEKYLAGGWRNKGVSTEGR